MTTRLLRCAGRDGGGNQRGLIDALQAMRVRDMRYFMGEHALYFVVVFHQRDHLIGDDHRPVRQGEGVGADPRGIAKHEAITVGGRRRPSVLADIGVAVEIALAALGNGDW
jgi:hypothetical protein